MTNTTIDLYNRSIQKTAEILKKIGVELNIGYEIRYSNQVLKTVLHVLRDRMTVEEAADFASQLPILVRGIFYETWQPAKVPIKMNKNEFLARIKNGTPIEVYSTSEEVFKVVLGVLNDFISKGEIKDVKSLFPRSLVEIFP